MQAVFDDSLITGNEMIDTQHKELIDRINKLLILCENEKPAKREAVETLDYLADYTEFHFGEEEKLQEEIGYPGIAEHKKKHEELRQVVKDLYTMLEEQGSNFSGGQRQRLAIARALLHDTPMYIFDEAASNIDVESEDQIMEVIRELAKTKTILFISHRLANVVASDQIYMLENGQITESGTHGELMKKAGSYANMYQKQQELCQVREGRA